eukprot:COSAG06_NODE_1519_length_9208_cov_3.443957_10_plen_51_part_00
MITHSAHAFARRGFTIGPIEYEISAGACVTATLRRYNLRDLVFNMHLAIR